MIGKNFVRRLTITSRQRWIATAVIYGLSLSVRFTSAAGEEVQIPPPSAQRTYPLASIMTNDGSRLLYHDWSRQTGTADRLTSELAAGFANARMHRPVRAAVSFHAFASLPTATSMPQPGCGGGSAFAPEKTQPEENLTCD